MPYSTVSGHEECADDEVAVVKDSDGEVMGCHASEGDAQEQIAALEASEEGRAVSLSDLKEEVATALYGHDSRSEDWHVAEIMIMEASEDMAMGQLVAYERMEERHFMVSFEFDGTEATLEPRSEWDEVTLEWQPVTEDEEERLRKQKRRRQSETQRGPDLNAQTRTFEASVTRDDDAGFTEVTINTDAVDGHGTVIEPDGMRLKHENREFSGRFFINHRMDLLAGFSPEPEVRDGRIVVRVPDSAWDLDDPEIKRWYRKVKKGLLERASIGFDPIDGETEERDGRRIYRYTDWLLEEWSFVPIGSNPEATVGAVRDRTQTAGVRRRVDDHEERLQELERQLGSGAPEANAEGQASEEDDTDQTTDEQEGIRDEKVRAAAREMFIEHQKSRGKR